MIPQVYRILTGRQTIGDRLFLVNRQPAQFEFGPYYPMLGRRIQNDQADCSDLR